MTDKIDGKDEQLGDWVGRTMESVGEVTREAVIGLEATLHSRKVTPQAGSPAPLLAHWLSFLDYPPLDQVGPDGHPRRGGFLPPVSLPRRMWAGSEIDFVRPVKIGVPLVRRSTIGSVVEKDGRSGRLVFVRVDHEIRDPDGVILTDHHNIVYRDAPAATAVAAPPPKPHTAPENPQWSRLVEPDPVLLFRYSALTFNGHRIHYDRPYAMAEEGYPGLVVHGPMIATLLLHEMVKAHPGATVKGFTFRAENPVFDTAPFKVCGSLDDDGNARLFAINASGVLCMSATAALA